MRLIFTVIIATLFASGPNIFPMLKNKPYKKETTTPTYDPIASFAIKTLLSEKKKFDETKRPKNKNIIKLYQHKRP